MHKLLVGDVRVLLPTLPDNSIDLVLTDPPYGMTQNEWDKPPDLPSLWQELTRVSRPTTPFIFTAAQPFASHLITSNPRLFKYDLVWHKNKSTGFLNANRQPLRTHEHILVFYDKPPTYNPQKTRNHKPGNYAKRTVASSNYGAQTSTEYGGSTERYPTSVLDISIINNDDPDKFHPTQKPVALMEWLIATYSNPGQIVLDPFGGSGTTAVAAKKLDRHCVLIELNPTYAEMAERRIANA